MGQSGVQIADNSLHYGTRSGWFAREVAEPSRPGSSIDFAAIVRSTRIRMTPSSMAAMIHQSPTRYFQKLPSRLQGFAKAARIVEPSQSLGQKSMDPPGNRRIKPQQLLSRVLGEFNPPGQGHVPPRPG
jgi:hypothetical protein